MQSRNKTSYPRAKIKILLLEGIHPAALQYLKDAGYQAQLLKNSPNEKELVKLIDNVHLLGIRSKTCVSAKVLQQAKNLLAIGCFCIGTNQVDLNAAALNGVTVFNAPFSNTRSVAELAMAEIVMLARRAVQKCMDLHAGHWDKSAEQCLEVRNKTLGIIGYGHIGPQLGLLAESFGMKVIYYDILPRLGMGTARQIPELHQLLRDADFVSLHVPETRHTRNLISAAELRKMRAGSYLLNLSRGSVVDIPALINALKSEHLAGAALDVFPDEPASNEQIFESELRGIKNLILTPHIGGATEEAQLNIGLEVSSSMLKFLELGSTSASVNFPQMEVPVVQTGHRILNIHRNVPGVLRDINKVVADMGANIHTQYLGTLGEVGYLIMDVDQHISRDIKSKIEKLDTNIRTRLLF